ncbi:MAG TPA: helix-turn-helix domain-containing protein [Terriglobia bacterium]|nr:helix-turn-helix domain-containing protein [Terriglobia bacterium]
MKNDAKNPPLLESYSASDAATLLGISIPTLRRMVKDGTLEGFRTPGGHLRVTADSIEGVKNQREARPRPVRQASPVLQNRRERLEELTLEAQEVRAKRELAKLVREEQQEAEKREAEARARQQEIARRQAELELQRERLENEQDWEWLRQQHEEDEQHAKWQAEQELAAFRLRWMQFAETEALYAKLGKGLSAAQTKEILDALEAEVNERIPQDEPQMPAILERGLAALVEPIAAAREANKRQESAAQLALRRLPAFATDSDKAQASEAIRKALAALPNEAKDVELRAAAEEAVRPIQQAVEKRLLDARMLNWAISQLPWSSTELEKARVRRECAEILAELPLEVSEADARDALEPTITEARQEIEQRQAEVQRQARKATLIQQGISEVSTYLLELEADDRISDEDYWDSEFTAALRESVRLRLESKLSGEEIATEVRALTRLIVNQEVNL